MQEAIESSTPSQLLKDPQPDVNDAPVQTGQESPRPESAQPVAHPPVDPHDVSTLRTLYMLYHDKRGMETCELGDEEGREELTCLGSYEDAVAHRLQDKEYAWFGSRILALDISSARFVSGEPTPAPKETSEDAPSSEGDQEEPQRPKPFVRLDTAEEICAVVCAEIGDHLMDIIRGAEAMTWSLDEVIGWENMRDIARKDRFILDYARDDIAKVHAKTLGENIDFTCLGESYRDRELPDDSTGYVSVIRGMLGMLAWRLDRIRSVTGTPLTARHMAKGDYWHGEVKGGAKCTTEDDETREPELAPLPSADTFDDCGAILQAVEAQLSWLTEDRIRDDHVDPRGRSPLRSTLKMLDTFSTDMRIRKTRRENCERANRLIIEDAASCKQLADRLDANVRQAVRHGLLAFDAAGVLHVADKGRALIAVK